MKRLLVGTPLGRLGQGFRESFLLVRTACREPEAVGTVANDVLAGTLVTSICRPDKVFIDVGAHIGSVIAEVMHQTPSVKIIAFEAIPQKIEHLRRKFPRVEFHECAVGEENKGQITFFVDTKQSGYSSLGKRSDAPDGAIQEIVVPLKRMDDLVDSDAVDVVKIDVEGAELGVLRGGERMIARCRPSILFESGPDSGDGLGYAKEALWQWCADREFQVLVPNRLAPDGPGLSQEGFLDSHLYPRRTTNYFAVPAERRLEIRDGARRVLKLKIDA